MTRTQRPALHGEGPEAAMRELGRRDHRLRRRWVRPLIRRLPSRREDPEGKVGFVQPMLALAVRKLPEGGAWSYELKFDGHRALCLSSHATAGISPSVSPRSQ